MVFVEVLFVRLLFLAMSSTCLCVLNMRRFLATCIDLKRLISVELFAGDLRYMRCSGFVFWRSILVYRQWLNRHFLAMCSDQ